MLAIAGRMKRTPKIVSIRAVFFRFRHFSQTPTFKERGALHLAVGWLFAPSRLKIWDCLVAGALHRTQRSGSSAPGDTTKMFRDRPKLNLRGTETPSLNA